MFNSLRSSRRPLLLPHLLSLSILSTLFIGQAFAQRPPDHQFQWKFTNDGLGDKLPTCLPLQILVQSFNTTLNDTFGIPPYYMVSLAVGGQPRTTYIGIDNKTLSWTIDHPPGTKLMLDVSDSTQSTGGIPPRLFEVIAGQSTQCVVNPPSQPTFTVTSNVTGDLYTCDPWGLRIKGGVPPYNLTLAALGSPVVTNVTLPFGADAYTYINRADPNTQLLAAISDLTGQWATGTPIVNTKGSPDYKCVGLVSSSGNSTQLEQEARDRQAAKDRKRAGVIAGVTVPVVLLFLVALAGLIWFIRRRRQQIAEREKEERDLAPTQYQYEELPLGNNQIRTGSLADTSFGGSNFSGKSLPPPPPGAAVPIADDSGVLIYRIPVTSSQSGSSTTNPPYRPTSANSDTATSTSADELRNRPSFASFPATPVRRSKAQEAAQNSRRSPDSEYPDADGPSDPSTPVVSSHHNTGTAGGSMVREEIIIQHRDGGINVRELPPPYADRTATSS